jgi:hypothetical protein
MIILLTVNYQRLLSPSTKNGPDVNIPMSDISCTGSFSLASRPIFTKIADLSLKEYIEQGNSNIVVTPPDGLFAFSRT